MFGPLITTVVLACHGEISGQVDTCDAPIGQDSESNQEKEINVRFGQTITGAMELSQARCIASGGRWLNTTYACVCPPDTLFVRGEGCQNVFIQSAAYKARGHFETTSRLEIDDLFQSLWKFGDSVATISSRDLNPDSMATLLAVLNQDFSRPWRGLTVLADWQLPRRTIRILSHNSMSLDSVDFKSWLQHYWMSGRELMERPYPYSFIGSDLDFVLNDSLASPGDRDYLNKNGDWIAQCTDALGIGNLCLTIYSVLDDLSNDRAGAMSVPIVSEEAPQCDPDCSIMRTFPSHLGRITYSVLMKHFVPIERRLDFTLKNQSDYAFFLGPLGQIDSIINYGLRALDDSEQELISAYRTIFNSSWKPVYHNRWSYGDRGSYDSFLLDPSRFGSFLLNDDENIQKQNKPIAALLVDSGVSFSAPGLSTRLLRSDVGHEHLPGERLVAYDNMGRTLPDILLGSLDGGGQGHGTAVASVMAANLPAATLSWINYRDVYQIGDPLKLCQAWVDKIKKEEIRVVNISIDYTRSFFGCSDFFDFLFSSNPDVLFIVGAGNSHVRVQDTTCPAGRARFHANVMSIAGNDRSGLSLADESNYGAEHVQIAAPMEALALSSKYQNGTSAYQLSPHFGTSYAAATVSNAAMRLWASRPEMGVNDVVSGLLSACHFTGLDVGCGGYLDMKRLEEIINESR